MAQHDSARRRAGHAAAARRPRRGRPRTRRLRAPLLAEERRLLVAAMGRARKRLLVTAIDGEAGDGTTRRCRRRSSTKSRSGPPDDRRWPSATAGRGAAGAVGGRGGGPAARRWCARRTAPSMTRSRDLRGNTIGAAGRGGCARRRPGRLVRHDTVSTAEPLWSDGDDTSSRCRRRRLQTLTDCPLRWLLERHGGTDARELRSTMGSLVHALIAEPGRSESQLLAELERVWQHLPFESSGIPATNWPATARCCRRSAQWREQTRAS